jgi:integrase
VSSSAVELGASTVYAAVKVARLVLGVALDAGAIKANPAIGLRLPRPGRTEIQFLTAGQVEALAEEIASPYQTLVSSPPTGLRAGEIGALRAGRLDLRSGIVEVTESLPDVNGTLIFGPPRTTPTGRASAAIPPAGVRGVPRHAVARTRGPRFSRRSWRTPPPQSVLATGFQACSAGSGAPRKVPLPRLSAYLRAVLYRLHG